MNVYITYEELKEYLQGIEGAGQLTKDDKLLKQFCIKSSRLFDTFTDKKFYPRLETRNYDHPPDPCKLWLDEHLLAVTTLTTNNGGVTVDSSDYLLMKGEHYEFTPYNRIRLKSTGTTTRFTYTNEKFQANQIIGTWGYHDDWSNAFEDSQDSVQDGGGINASVTTVTVSGVDGTGRLGLTPRFKVQQLIKIDSEYLWITAKDVENNTLDVIRGVNGTTAATHANLATIEIFRPMPHLVNTMEVLASHQYRRRNSVGGADDRAIASSTGLLLLPSRLPAEVQDMLMKYRSVSV